MPTYPKGCLVPRDLANRIGVSHSRFGSRLLALPDVTLAQYDCRTLGFVTPIKNQGNCGDCWNFAGIGAAEMAAIIGGLGTADTVNWSEQSVLDCGSNGGCNGDWPETALEQAKNSGIANTSDYPYRGGRGHCRNVPHTNFVTSYGYVGSSEAVPSVQAIKNSLFAHGPLAVAVAADDAFANYRPGTVFKDSGSRDIDHAVILVGWDDSKGAWIMRNHWGTDWGNEGYMDIEYGANQIGYGAMWAVAGNPNRAGIDWSTI
jgi:C1A family cysteine protease